MRIGIQLVSECGTAVWPDVSASSRGAASDASAVGSSAGLACRSRALQEAIGEQSHEFIRIMIDHRLPKPRIPLEEVPHAWFLLSLENNGLYCD